MAREGDERVGGWVEKGEMGEDSKVNDEMGEKPVREKRRKGRTRRRGEEGRGRKKGEEEGVGEEREEREKREEENGRE